MQYKSVSIQTLKRLPGYLAYLKSLPEDQKDTISATNIAEALKLNHVQVRKDLASVCAGGRPKVGYIKKDLIQELEHYLGYDDTSSAVIVGAGNLGRALLSYDGFSKYGVEIVTAFEIDSNLIGSTVNGKKILAYEKLKGLCNRMNIRIGILTVPDEEAQKVCDEMVESGILAIWNFTSVQLKVPEQVLVHNENMASSLTMFTKRR